MRKTPSRLPPLRLLFTGAGLLLLGAGALAPSLAHAQTAPAAIIFERDIQPIFDERCVSCHMTGAENGGLNLEDGISRSRLINVPSTEARMPRVTPGNIARSYLLHKLRGTQTAAGGNGDRMPLGGSAISQQELALIQRWIQTLPARPPPR